MLVNKLLSDIEAQEKLAAQVTPDPKQAAESQLSSALGETLSKVASQAAPAAGDPVRDLFKLAEDVANAEKQGEVQQAALCGRAFAHAAINEFAAYDHAAKVAAAQPYQHMYEEAVKVAASDDELQKAAELGYQDAAIRIQQEVAIQGQTKEAQMEEKLASVNLDENVMEKMAQVGYVQMQEKIAAEQFQMEKMAQVGYVQTQEKIAAEQFQQGYDSCMGEVRDRAAEEFLKGAQEVDALVQMSQQV